MSNLKLNENHRRQDGHLIHKMILISVVKGSCWSNQLLNVISMATYDLLDLHMEMLYTINNFIRQTYPIIWWEHGLECNTEQQHQLRAQSRPAWTARARTSWMYWKTMIILKFNLHSGKKAIMFPQSSRKTQVPKNKPVLFSWLNDELKGLQSWLDGRAMLFN